MDSEKIEEFFREFYEKEILAAARQGKKFITVDFDAFDRHCHLIAEKLLNDPEAMLPEIEKAASDAVVLPEIEGAANFRVRFKNLPEHQNIRIRSLRSEHIGKFLCVDGVVKRASEVKPKIDVAEFECECGNKISVKQTEQLLKYPSGCDMCGNKRGFKIVSQKLFDSRWLAIEEPFEATSGEKPGQVSIYLKEDLTSPDMQRKCDPGNRIKVTGTVNELPLKTKGGARKTQFDIFIEANHVEPAEIEWEDVDISGEDEQRIKALAADPDVYKKIVASIAPSIYGLEEVKEAILLQTMGGVHQKLLDGTKVRGDIHILLLGDPAVAKSQLLKMVSQLIPRGKYVSGKGATGAGLTATVFRDEELMGGWVLEAGAMVLCHKGVLCIDEFDKMNKDDQIAMHEALEQQSYHPNTEITLADGSKHKIGNFVDGLMEGNKNKIIKGKDCEILPVDGVSILTTDFRKIYPAKVNRISRHIAPERFVNITFSNGRSILVTPEHPVFILNGTEIKTVPAESAKKDMFVPMPKKLPFSGLSGNLKKIGKAHFNEKEILQPEKITTELARVLGYYVSEGHSFVGERCREIGFTNSDAFILGDMKSSMSDVFGVQPYSYERHPDVFTDRYSSTQLHRFFESNFPEVLEKARSKKAPDLILKCTNDIVKHFLSAAYLGDGFVDSERFGFCTTSSDLAKGYQELLLKTGIYSYIAEDGKQKAFKVVISGTESMKLFLDNIVDAHDYRRDRINAFISRSAGKNRQRGDFPFLFGKTIKEILSFLKIDDGYFQPSLKNGITKQTVKKYIDKIRERTSCMRKAIESERNIARLRYSCKISQQDIENKYGVKRQTISYIERCKFHKRKDEIMGFIRAISEERIKTAEEFCKTPEKFLDSDISWIRIKNAEVVENKNCKYVYDVTVEPTKSFVSECLVLHNTISIAKASIIATLPAQVSVLAGANPKFSRFDVYRPLVEQTDIPDTLLSRFDLKFALRDVPDKERDEKIASHILESRLNPELRKPEISQEFMRKYIAYMRQNCHPKMTKETLDRIKNFYVTMRGMYKGEDTVAITLRQNEALLRMAEASAKVRFSTVVEEQDAERAIRIMKVSLQQFGYDYETGKIDVDRTEGTSSSQRSKIRILMDVIEELEKRIGKQIPKEDIVAEAEDHGLKGVDEMIQKLKSEGMLFEPKHNVIQKL